VIPRLLAVVLFGAASSAAVASVDLPVPVIRQAPERCGPAALAMVLRFYGVDSARAAAADAAYDPALRGARATPGSTPASPP